MDTRGAGVELRAEGRNVVMSAGMGVGERGRGKKGGENVVPGVERGREGGSSGGETRERKVEQEGEAEKGWQAGEC